MPSYNKLVSSIALALMACSIVLGAPTEAAVPYETVVEHEGRNLTFTRGSSFVSESLSKRSTPPECQFEGKAGDYYYLLITGLPDGNACMGWSAIPMCGSGDWSDPDFSDIQIALSEVVAMDGQWSSSQSGSWSGTFSLFTTAFSNRDTTPFGLALAISNSKALTYYWSRDNNFASVLGYNDQCP
jgi:hypothetical protein